MPIVLPLGFVTLEDGAEEIEHVLFSGEADRPEVVRVRAALGHEVGDGTTSSNAFAAIWQAIDERQLRLMAIGGLPRRVLGVSPQFSRSIPHLRRTRSFVYLRPSHPNWKQVTGWFGPDFAEVILAVREAEVKRLVLRLKRKQRRARPKNADAKVGRPSRQAPIREAIEQLIEQKRWSTERSLKELTLLINRKQTSLHTVSEDTVARALDSLHKLTKDRRYARVRRGSRRAH